jgi:hypothetical protein
MPPTKKPDIYIANQGFGFMLDGAPINVQKGDLLDPNSPEGKKVLKGRENFFDPAEPEDYVKFGPKRKVEPALEQATSAPGEQRD